MDSQTAVPTTSPNGFVYPPLPLGQDAIRLLQLKPGGFHDPLEATIKAVTLESRSKYVALSYTWSDPHPTSPQSPTSGIAVQHARARSVDASFLPKGLRDKSPNPVAKGLPQSLTVNATPFHLAHNLHLALLHLRSVSTPLTLWIDAICINQADITERNAQVSLMYFIYQRAQLVVAWVGMKEYKNQTDPFFRMSVDWKGGRSQHLAASIERGEAMRRSAEPDGRTIARIVESSYWNRLWIVQELCLPLQVIVAYGASVWPYEDFRKWISLRTPKAQTPIQSAPSALQHRFRTMVQLFDTRDAKHTDAAALENLIKTFATNQCSEVRDRVYGLLGLANDISSVTEDCPQEITADAEDNPLVPHKYYYLGTQDKRRGLRVDYTRSLYEIWTDVIMFISRDGATVQQEPYSRNIQVWDRYDCSSMGHSSQSHGDSHTERDKRYRLNMRNAGVVQQAFNQAVEADTADSTLCKVSRVFSTLRATNDSVRVRATSRLQQGLELQDT